VPTPSSSDPLDGPSVLVVLLRILHAWRHLRRRLFPPLLSSPEARPDPPPAGALEESPTRQLFGFLVTFHSDLQGTFGVILSGHTQVGREAHDGIMILDKRVSACHASLYVDPDTEQVFVEDEGSTNGTLVNEVRLSPGERRELKDNDYVRFGSIMFIVKLLAREYRDPPCDRTHPYR
jgi:pSer/pThr/pTyr-binding forkhead associated (FHA) protein